MATPADPPLLASEIQQRKLLARVLLAPPPAQLEVEELEVDIDVRGLAAAKGPAAKAKLEFPAGTAPKTAGAQGGLDPAAPLGSADVLVVVWTADECEALADILTPGRRRSSWQPYRHRFEQRYLPQIRNGAPARAAGRLGSFCHTEIAGLEVCCFKSELHLNQDGKRTGEGTATLPVKDLFLQLIDEVSPRIVISTGTAGGVADDHDLGDVVVTRAAMFRCQDEFAAEPFAKRAFRSDWKVPTRRFAAAEKLMRRFADELEEPAFGPPTKRYPFEGPLLESSPKNVPGILLDGRDFAPFHPILTADFYEFGTTANRLDREGCALEMGDAVLGLACAELDEPPPWVIVRSISDPVINGDLPTHRDIARNMQAVWATWYYKTYGYWTSVNGALATWAVIAGLDLDG